MRILDPSQYARLRPLLNELLPFNNSIAAVLTRNNPGRAYVDHPDATNVLFLMSAL